MFHSEIFVVVVVVVGLSAPDVRRKYRLRLFLGAVDLARIGGGGGGGA